MKRVFSGIQPSGALHLGNYIGAIQQWVSLIDEYECFFCVVDYHAISVQYDVASFQSRIWDVILDSVACGVDPRRSKFFVQSHVPEHTELAWILNTVTSVGDLERMTQYKDKSRQYEHNINAALLNYPILQAADILLYKAEYVPVGEDQRQHIELARRIARSFNARFQELFPEPEIMDQNFSRQSTGSTNITHTDTRGKRLKLLGLDGKQKMSKSLNNSIGLSDDSDTLKKKIRSAVTDTQRIRRSDAGTPEQCNVYTWHTYFTDTQELQSIYKECRLAQIGCTDCKNILHTNLQAFLTPLQAKRHELKNHVHEIQESIYHNGKLCKAEAQKTLHEVKNILGLLSPSIHI